MLVHHLLVVNARIKKPPVDPVLITEWKKKLISDIGMNLLSGPHALYHDMPGNRGLTAVSVIDTSHICLHVWDEPEVGVLRLDVYSCAKFDINTVLDSIKEFEPVHVDWKFLDRTDDNIGIQ